MLSSQQESLKHKEQPPSEQPVKVKAVTTANAAIKSANDPATFTSLQIEEENFTAEKCQLQQQQPKQQPDLIAELIKLRSSSYNRQQQELKKSFQNTTEYHSSLEAKSQTRQLHQFSLDSSNGRKTTQDKKFSTTQNGFRKRSITSEDDSQEILILEGRSSSIQRYVSPLKKEYETPFMKKKKAQMLEKRQEQEELKRFQAMEEEAKRQKINETKQAKDDNDDDSKVLNSHIVNQIDENSSNNEQFQTEDYQEGTQYRANSNVQLVASQTSSLLRMNNTNEMVAFQNSSFGSKNPKQHKATNGKTREGKESAQQTDEFLLGDKPQVSEEYFHKNSFNNSNDNESNDFRANSLPKAEQQLLKLQDEQRERSTSFPEGQRKQLLQILFAQKQNSANVTENINTLCEQSNHRDDNEDGQDQVQNDDLVERTNIYNHDNLMSNDQLDIINKDFSSQKQQQQRASSNLHHRNKQDAVSPISSGQQSSALKKSLRQNNSSSKLLLINKNEENVAGVVEMMEHSIIQTLNAQSSKGPFVQGASSSKKLLISQQNNIKSGTTQVVLSHTGKESKIFVDHNAMVVRPRGQQKAATTQSNYYISSARDIYANSSLLPNLQRLNAATVSNDKRNRLMNKTKNLRTLKRKLIGPYDNLSRVTTEPTQGDSDDSKRQAQKFLKSGNQQSMTQRKRQFMQTTFNVNSHSGYSQSLKPKVESSHDNIENVSIKRLDLQKVFKQRGNEEQQRVVLFSNTARDNIRPHHSRQQNSYRQYQEQKASDYQTTRSHSNYHMETDSISNMFLQPTGVYRDKSIDESILSTNRPQNKNENQHKVQFASDDSARICKGSTTARVSQTQEGSRAVKWRSLRSRGANSQEGVDFASFHEMVRTPLDERSYEQVQKVVSPGKKQTNQVLKIIKKREKARTSNIQHFDDIQSKKLGKNNDKNNNDDLVKAEIYQDQRDKTQQLSVHILNSQEKLHQQQNYEYSPKNILHEASRNSTLMVPSQQVAEIAEPFPLEYNESIKEITQSQEVASIDLSKIKSKKNDKKLPNQKHQGKNFVDYLKKNKKKAGIMTESMMKNRKTFQLHAQNLNNRKYNATDLDENLKIREREDKSLRQSVFQSQQPIPDEKSTAINNQNSNPSTSSIEKIKKHSDVEVAPWTEGKRHLNFSQRYRQNQVNVSKATYGLETSHLKNFNNKIGKGFDFARQDDHRLLQQSSRQSTQRSSAIEKRRPYSLLYQSQQDKSLQAQKQSQMMRIPNKLSVKLVSYRSHSIGFNQKESDADSTLYQWGNKDLNELQNTHKEVEYVDLVNKKNLQFHQMSEWKQEQIEILERKLQREDLLVTKSSKIPKDQQTMYSELREGIQKTNFFENYKQKQLSERVKKLRDCRQRSNNNNLEYSIKQAGVESLQQTQALKDDSARQDIMQEQGQVTKYLNKLLKANNNMKQNMTQVDSVQKYGSKKEKVSKFLDHARQKQQKEDRINQRYTFRPKSQPSGHSFQIKPSRNFKMIDLEQQLGLFQAEAQREAELERAMMTIEGIEGFEEQKSSVAGQAGSFLLNTHDTNRQIQPESSKDGGIRIMRSPLPSQAYQLQQIQSQLEDMTAIIAVAEDTISIVDNRETNSDGIVHGGGTFFFVEQPALIGETTFPIDNQRASQIKADKNPSQSNNNMLYHQNKQQIFMNYENQQEQQLLQLAQVGRDPPCRQTVMLRNNLPITDYRGICIIDTEGSADSYQRKMVEPSVALAPLLQTKQLEINKTKQPQSLRTNNHDPSHNSPGRTTAVQYKHSQRRIPTKQGAKVNRLQEKQQQIRSNTNSSLKYPEKQKNLTDQKDNIKVQRFYKALNGKLDQILQSRHQSASISVCQQSPLQVIEQEQKSQKSNQFWVRASRK